MKKTYTFPSVYEETSVLHPQVASSFLDGMKLSFNGNSSYMVGKMALNEGLSPHKFINSSSDDMDYRVLALSGLVLATGGKFLKMRLTTGFPFITYPSYEGPARDFFKRHHEIVIDTRPFGGKANETVNVEIDHLDIITEVEGCVFAIREGEFKEKDNFFIASLGYGTFELALSTPSGLVIRTTFSSRGIEYAVKIFEKEIQKMHYTTMIPEKEIEDSFQRGYIIINRKKIDITSVRSKALKMYYTEVISPAMRKKFSNKDFDNTTKIYLAGGGAIFNELVEEFETEFKDILEVRVYPEPHLCAGHGYCINSARKLQQSSGSDILDRITSVGLDIGNSNTVVVAQYAD